jgi:hypothetical protein
MLSELIFFVNCREMRLCIVFMREENVCVDDDDSNDEKLSQVVLELLKCKGGPRSGSRKLSAYSLGLFSLPVFPGWYSLCGSRHAGDRC